MIQLPSMRNTQYRLDLSNVGRGIEEGRELARQHMLMPNIRQAINRGDMSSARQQMAAYDPMRFLGAEQQQRSGAGMTANYQDQMRRRDEDRETFAREIQPLILEAMSILNDPARGRGDSEFQRLRTDIDNRIKTLHNPQNYGTLDRIITEQQGDERLQQSDRAIALREEKFLDSQVEGAYQEAVNFIPQTQLSSRVLMMNALLDLANKAVADPSNVPMQEMLARQVSGMYNERVADTQSFLSQDVMSQVQRFLQRLTAGHTYTTAELITFRDLVYSAAASHNTSLDKFAEETIKFYGSRLRTKEGTYVPAFDAATREKWDTAIKNNIARFKIHTPAKAEAGEQDPKNRPFSDDYIVNKQTGEVQRVTDENRATLEELVKQRPGVYAYSDSTGKALRTDIEGW